MQFDGNQQIQQIRLSWDQGSLLKNIDVIGARGRNWPIHDGKDHARLIKSSVEASTTAVPTARRSKNEHEVVITSRGPPGASPSKGPHQNVTRDPHASLALFAPRDENDEDNAPPAVIAPRASAKPPPRDYHDLFVGNHSNDAPQATSKGRSFAGAGNSHDDPIAPKGGAGKNYKPSRLFDHDSPADEQATPNHQAEHFYKPNPAKYRHFDFADGSEEIPEKDLPKPASPLKPRTTKHGSQWNFEDFSTPAKPKNKVRGQDVRHFGWSDDEGELTSPVKVPKVDKPRRDAETHFQFEDQGTPAAAEEKRPSGPPKGSTHSTASGLYENNLYTEESPAKATQSSQPSQPSQPSRPLGNVTNINHRKVFDSQFEMTDDSPSSKDKMAEKPAATQHQAAVKMMDSNWDAYDQSPKESKKENVPGKGRNTGIATAGDGMGGRKGSGRQWGFGDDSDGEETGGVNGSGFQKGVPGKKQNQAPADNGIWNY